jgi:hypothetical protein
MTASRLSLAALFALLAWSAAAQSGGGATAPPRSLSGQKPPAAAQPQPPSDDSDSDQPPPSSSDRDRPPDVDTSGLLDDNEDAPKGNSPKAPPGGKAGAPAPPDAVEETPLPAGPVIPPRGKIQAEALGAVDESAGGSLDPSNGGLDANMWAGSPHDDIEKLLARAPLASADTAVRALARKVVLTKADNPGGKVTKPLIAIRLEKLRDAGFVDDTASLALSTPAKNDAALARAEAEAILIAGKATEACGGATEARLTEGDIFWLELRAYCAAAAGDTATAELTRSVIDAQGRTDPAYTILVDDALNGGKKPPGPIAKPNAMHVFLLRRAGQPIPADLAKHFAPGVSVLSLRDPHNPPDARMAAAERVVKLGAATHAELKAVADAQAIPADRIAKAATEAPKLSFLAGQALLRRAAQLEARPPAKAALVHQALLMGEKAELFEVAASLQADIAATIDPKSVPQDQAPLIGWSLMLAGKSQAAARWLGNEDAAKPVLALVSGKDADAQAALSDIARRLAADPPKPDANRPFEALTLGLTDALGLTLPADAKAQAASAAANHWPGRRPDADTMQHMVQAAAAADRKGEAVLRILDIVGAKGPGDLAPDVTIELVRALGDMGLKDPARALAIHALLLYRPAAP